jgi:hypothetical protein
MALKTFLSKTPSLASSDFDSTQVSEPYASTDLIKALYDFILFFMDRNCDLNCLLQNITTEYNMSTTSEYNCRI